MVGIDISTCICECPFMSDRLLHCIPILFIKLFYEILSCVEYPILSTENSGKLVKLFQKMFYRYRTKLCKLFEFM